MTDKMTSERKTIFLLTIKADFPMSEHDLRNKFKHWIEYNCHTTSSFGFEIEEMARPIVQGIAE